MHLHSMYAYIQFLENDSIRDIKGIESLSRVVQYLCAGQVIIELKVWIGFMGNTMIIRCFRVLKVARME